MTYGGGKHADSHSKTTTVRIFDESANAGGTSAIQQHHSQKRSVGTSQKMVSTHVSKQLTCINGADRLHPYVSQEAVNLMRSKLASTKRTLNSHNRSGYHHVQSSDNLHHQPSSVAGTVAGSSRKQRHNQHSHIA